MNAIGRSSQRAVCRIGASVGPAGNALTDPRQLASGEHRRRG